MVWLPDSEKKLKISLFVLTQCTNVTDTHTQTDTAWRHRPRLCIASSGKNDWSIQLSSSIYSLLLTLFAWRVFLRHEDKRQVRSTILHYSLSHSTSQIHYLIFYELHVHVFSHYRKLAYMFSFKRQMTSKKSLKIKKCKTNNNSTNTQATTDKQNANSRQLFSLHILS